MMLQDEAPGVFSFKKEDRIFVGEGLFETIKVEDGILCYPQLHWQRMHDSAHKLGIPFDLSFDRWCAHLQDNIQQNTLLQGGIKVILSGDSAPRGLVQQATMSQLRLQTFRYTLEDKPVRLLPAKWLRDASNPLYQFKSINYLEAILARREALASGADDALFFNLQHHVTETTCANLFLIKEDVLYTPPLMDGVLPGTTRKRILGLAANNQLACYEQSISQSMLANADAVFICNALQGIRIVQSIDERNFSINHPMLMQLMALL